MPVLTNPPKGSDPTWVMFISLPCIVAASVLAGLSESALAGFAILFATCLLLDLSPAGRALRGRRSSKLAAKGYGRQGRATLAGVELAGGVGALILFALATAEPRSAGFGAALAGLFVASSISTWRIRAELRETVS